MVTKLKTENEAKELQIKLNGIMIKHGISKKGLSDYYGVPEQTVYKWLKGERYPGSASLRLIEVLETIALMAPEIHQHLINPDK